MPSAEPILRGTALCRTYWLDRQPVTGVRDLDIEVWPGQVTALQGPSGSGKTTLLNLLGLLDAPDSGSLELDGEDVRSLGERERAAVRRDRFGFVFQTFNLIPVLSAAENVEVPMTLRGVAPLQRRDRALALLAEVGLADKANARPDRLSGGQRQRVAIARALANRPEIVFADEPTAALDSRTAGEILDVMVRLNREQGVAFLFATHDPRVVERAGRVLTLCDGQVVGERTVGGTP